MRPGIIVQHARESVREDTTVRSDIAGMIAVIPRVRWPKKLTPGDFIELTLANYADLVQNPLHTLLDPITLTAVRLFFENGGRLCRLLGVFIDTEKDLVDIEPYGGVFMPLLDRLRGAEDIALLYMPILAYMRVEYDPKGKATFSGEPLMRMLLQHAHEMVNRFVIFDAPKDLHDRALFDFAQRFRKEVAAHASYGAMYYPWLKNGDEVFPAGGPVIGVFARVDLEHAPFGVRWPPANEVLRGVSHPAVELRWAESGRLADLGINAILVQASRGVVIWGARTLSTEERWLHINSRRIVSYISDQLQRDAAWTVFENQREELWHILRRMAKTRLDEMWAAGLLTGDVAGQDYLVKCDAELNPREVRDAGYVNVQVMLRPVSTAEFIVVELRLAGDNSGV